MNDDETLPEYTADHHAVCTVLSAYRLVFSEWQQQQQQTTWQQGEFDEQTLGTKWQRSAPFLLPTKRNMIEKGKEKLVTRHFKFH